MSKNKQNSGRQRPKQKAPSKRKATPFADVGTIVGRAAGNMFGLNGSGVGRWLGSGIGSIFGSGDYTMTNSTPSYNVITNGQQIPKFSTTSATNTVCHREYIGDFVGTTGFNNNSFPLNPGMSETFPWLSSIAQNYQEYRFHGLVFEFRSLLTDFVTGGSPGVVIMATNYNADAKAFKSKQEMENSEYAVATKPTTNLMHGIECALSQTVLPQKYVRTGAVPAGQDLRLYDLGNYQFATQLNPNQNLGELWVSYCVEFFKPILPTDGISPSTSIDVARTTVSSAAPLGLIQSDIYGDLDAVVTSTSITFPSGPGKQWLVQAYWEGSVAANFQVPGVTLANAIPLSTWANGSVSAPSAPNNGVSTVRAMQQYMVQCSALNPTNIVVTFNGAGVFPSGTTTCDVTVTSFDEKK